MSEYPWPDSEHIEGEVDWLHSRLPDLLVSSQERIEELEQRVHDSELACKRYEEGLTCLLWLFSRLSTNRGVSVKVLTLTELLEEAARFGSVGVVPEWLETARRQMGFS